MGCVTALSCRDAWLACNSSERLYDDEILFLKIPSRLVLFLCLFRADWIRWVGIRCPVG